MNRFEVGQKTATESDFREQPDLLLLEVDAVPEQAARRQQPVARVDLRVGPRPREQLLDGRDLAPVLAQMRLHQRVRELARERARRLELGVGRGDGEARRDDVEQPVPPVPALQKRPALGVAPLGRVEQARRRAPVHHHLAGRHPHPPPLRLGEEGVDQFRVDRAVDRGRRRPVAQELVEEEARTFRRVGRVAELLLLDEGVLLQPVQQLRAVRGDDARLREVDVRVDQPRQDELVRVAVHRRPGREARQELRRVPDRLDHPVADQDHPVREVAVPVLGEAQHPPAHRPGRHPRPSRHANPGPMLSSLSPPDLIGGPTGRGGDTAPVPAW